MTKGSLAWCLNEIRTIHVAILWREILLIASGSSPGYVARITIVQGQV